MHIYIHIHRHREHSLVVSSMPWCNVRLATVRQGLLYVPRHTDDAKWLLSKRVIEDVWVRSTWLVGELHLLYYCRSSPASV